MNLPPHIIIMGVTGTGKTTVGQALAHTLAADFYDADDYHPPANIAKMRAGQPLTDADRLPWLQTLQQLLRERHHQGKTTILACSALRQSYRDLLLPPTDPAAQRTLWIHLQADAQTLSERLSQRPDHFMPPSLIQSQLDTLETPPNALTLDTTHPLPTLIDQIKTHLKTTSIPYPITIQQSSPPTI